ncbi:uncharacterized protein [Littorina saxatilis]|uniref:uncharacterized protein n=1 Tax=Littorina saxatilis TaxID=31220 RepID=UPI0038B4E2FB
MMNGELRSQAKSDKLFNPERAKICARHSTSMRTASNTGRLIQGSLPTEIMPQKSIEKSKTHARREPTFRPAPELLEVGATTTLKNCVVMYSSFPSRGASRRTRRTWLRLLCWSLEASLVKHPGWSQDVTPMWEEKKKRTSPPCHHCTGRTDATARLKLSAGVLGPGGNPLHVSPLPCIFTGVTWAKIMYPLNCK